MIIKYGQFKVDNFTIECHFSVPGVSQRLAFQMVDSGDTFHLFNRRHKDLVDLFLGNNVGGPAIIFQRFQEAGKSISLLIGLIYIEIEIIDTMKQTVKI